MIKGTRARVWVVSFVALAGCQPKISGCYSMASPSLTDPDEPGFLGFSLDFDGGEYVRMKMLFGITVEYCFEQDGDRLFIFDCQTGVDEYQFFLNEAGQYQNGLFRLWPKEEDYCKA